MKKAATKAEKEWMSRVAALGCMVSNHECCAKIEVHHLTGCGMALRASHYQTMPLCFNHHSAQTPLPFGHAVHKGTKSFEKRYGTQLKMIKRVKELLGHGS